MLWNNKKASDLDRSFGMECDKSVYVRVRKCNLLFWNEAWWLVLGRVWSLIKVVLCRVQNNIDGGHAQTFFILCCGVKLSTWNVLWRHADTYMLGTELGQHSLYDDCAVGWWSWFQLLVGVQVFSFLQNACTGSGTNAASCAMGSGVSLPRGRAAGSWSPLLSFI